MDYVKSSHCLPVSHGFEDFFNNVTVLGIDFPMPVGPSKTKGSGSVEISVGFGKSNDYLGHILLRQSAWIYILNLRPGTI